MHLPHFLFGSNFLYLNTHLFGLPLLPPFCNNCLLCFLFCCLHFGPVFLVMNLLLLLLQNSLLSPLLRGFLRNCFLQRVCLTPLLLCTVLLGFLHCFFLALLLPIAHLELLLLDCCT